jgi:apolipoprotein N-acyltransferase
MESQQLLAKRTPVAQTAKTDSLPAGEQKLAGRKSRVLIPALLSAALLWACYFPLNAGWLGWVALVPLLSLVRSAARPRRIYFTAWLSALVFFIATLQWVRVADPRMLYTWIGLSIWCSFFTVAGIYLVRRVDRRTALPLTLTVPIVWTALELGRAHIITGFPWYFLAHTQHAFLPAIQISDLAGAYGVTFVVAAVNGWLFELLARQAWCRRLLAFPEDGKRSSHGSLLWQTAAMALLVGGTLGYGMWRLGQEVFEKGPLVALLQGNLDQRIRNVATMPGGSAGAIDTFQKHYANLCKKAQKDQPRLIVWPETSFLYRWEEVAPELPPDKLPREWKDSNADRLKTAKTVADNWHSNVLLGVKADALEADKRERQYNSAVLIKADGQIAGRYDKMHCVPFGEYVPLRDWLPWLNKFAPYDYDYSITPGKQFTRFALDKYHFGVVICYEDTDPTLARQYVRSAEGEPTADFLINISNDGWFDGTSQHEEHLAICRFRAVECRRTLARAVNMGVSAVIDGNGRVIALPGPTWQESKKVAAVLTAALPIDHRSSLYAQWGDWLPWSCWLAIGAGFLGTFFWPIRSSRDKLAAETV